MLLNFEFECIQNIIIKYIEISHKLLEFETFQNESSFYVVNIQFSIGKSMHLSEEAEEVATFYAKMLEHDYVTKEVFNKNFFKDWRKVRADIIIFLYRKFNTLSGGN